jgi:CRISPR-associated protein Csb2
MGYTRIDPDLRAAKPRILRPTVPTVARYALDGPVLPTVQATLIVAESMRRALMSRYRKGMELERYGRLYTPNAERFCSQMFSGKDESGPLRDDHAHAFYLPTDDDGDGRLDHVTVYASAGFHRAEVRAIDTLRYLKCGDLELSLLLVGLGSPAEFQHTRALSNSAVWVSATPFLVTRHLKRRGRKRDPREFFDSPSGGVEFVEHVLREELARRGSFPELMQIDHLDRTVDRPPLRAIQFQLNRRYKRGDIGASRPRGLFRIRFLQPVDGPVVLGHSCHFGLGLFLPEGDQ